MAVGYDTGRGLTEHAMSAWRLAARPILGTGPDGPLLDLGAGTGRFSGQIHAWTGVPVVAVEPAREMSRRLVAKRLVGVVGVMQASAEALPLNDNTMAGAWLSQVVHHISDLGTAARELQRTLRSNAPVLLRGVFGDGAVYGEGVNSLLYHYFPEAKLSTTSFPTQRAVVDTFVSAGFAFETTLRVEQVTASSLHDFYARTARRADSTLAAIDDGVFARGLAALGADADRERQPRPVVDTLDLLVLRRLA
jgi:ubiquinone/menaquinone biosynthesis C-methylase UbiE